MNSPSTIDLDAASHFRCYQLDPIRDSRWAELVAKHPKASVFHTVAWLQALYNTYGYVSVAFTTSPPGDELQNGVVFCRIESWLTGRRLVSLPFSDHCEPLCDSTQNLNAATLSLQSVVDREKWKSVELRPVDEHLEKPADGKGFAPSATYFLHRLDLRPDLSEIFQGLDKDSVQRRIQRAERAGLVEKCGRSVDLLEDFYRLFVMTRGRQHVPPSPRAWFRNLIDCLGAALEIRVAYKQETPVAAILTLQFKDVVYYKYGCSDSFFNKLGATPWLFWRAITSAKSRDANEFDLGRTEQDNPGLLEFKNHWVPQPERLTYWRYPNAPPIAAAGDWKWKLAKSAFSLMPNRCLTLAGKLLYRHIG
jgi:hypothetical protein